MGLCILHATGQEEMLVPMPLTLYGHDRDQIEPYKVNDVTEAHLCLGVSEGVE